MGAEQMTKPRRRFFTTRNVEDARSQGVLVLGPRDVLTDEARARARELEVEVVRASDAAGEPALPSGTAAPASASRHMSNAVPVSPQRVTVPPPAAGGPALRDVVLVVLRRELGDVDGLERLVDDVLAQEGL